MGNRPELSLTEDLQVQDVESSARERMLYRLELSVND